MSKPAAQNFADTIDMDVRSPSSLGEVDLFSLGDEIAGTRPGNTVEVSNMAELRAIRTASE